MFWGGNPILPKRQGAPHGAGGQGPGGPDGFGPQEPADFASRGRGLGAGSRRAAARRGQGSGARGRGMVCFAAPLRSRLWVWFGFDFGGKWHRFFRNGFVWKNVVALGAEADEALEVLDGAAVLALG